MKRLFALLAGCVLLLTAACGKSDDPSASSNKASSSASSNSASSSADTSSAVSQETSSESVPNVDYTARTYALADYTDCFHVTGRTMAIQTAYADQTGLLYDHAGQGLLFTAYCEGDVSLDMVMVTSGETGKNYQHFSVRVDGNIQDVGIGHSTDPIKTLPIATGLPRGQHTFAIYRCNEALAGAITLLNLTMTGEVQPYQAPASPLKMIFLGDSITAGNGVLGTKGAPDQSENKYKDATLSYAFRCGELLEADFSIVAQSGLNFGTDTTDNNCVYSCYNVVSKARNPRVPYDNAADADQVDVYVISLGTNVKSSWTVEDITGYVTKLVEQVRADHPSAKIVWTYGQLAQSKDKLYAKIIADLGGASANLYYYCYEQADLSGSNSHPNAEAHERDAQELADFIRTIW